ncbi:MAG: acylneuraminate cytidylyltransferase family protein [Patescibacteria group bacterium]|nr:acylneuraminate cytidylyltransferase family protein [Patescibacteria group bacterium]
MIMAVIPARSGSKSVKNKNIRSLGGRPLMAWSIKAALACKQIDKTVVSTDSRKYAQLAEFYGAEVINRPAELAQDNTPMIEVLQHVLSVKTADTIVLLDPTSPFRLVKDIDACLEKINEPETDSVVTVTEAEHNPYFIMGTIDHNDYWQYPLIKTDEPVIRRQDAPKVWQLNAGVYVIKKEIIERGEIFTKKTKAVRMPIERSVHIDTELDFKFAEYLLKEGYVKQDY